MNLRRAALLFLVVIFCTVGVSLLPAAEARVRGIWVWKTTTILAQPGSAEALRDFCRAKGINEVYLSLSRKAGITENARLPEFLAVLHGAKIRVEALYGSADADVPGKPREALLDQVRAVLAFNAAHPTNGFEGIHLDIEPHQRAENKGDGNLKFLPNLIATFRAVHALAAPAGLTVNADLANKVLKADVAERRELLLSVDRVTLMLYELSSPTDGRTTAQQMSKLKSASERYLGLTYAGVNDPMAARMVIALRTADYGEHLPDMLKSLDAAHGQNPHYQGWARHSYNDMLK